MKKYLVSLLSVLLALVLFANCEETKELPEFDNWKQKNSLFIDSIANVARANTDGDWRVYIAEGCDTLETANEYFVYCKILESGSGTVRYLQIIVVVLFPREVTQMVMSLMRHFRGN